MHKPLHFLPSLLLGLVLLITGCTKEVPVTPDPFDPALAKTLLNEAYGPSERHKADVYLPAGRSASTPVIVMLHGGSWTEGKKEDLAEVVNLIRTQWPQAALVNMNYTLANHSAPNYHPAQMNDIARLLTYLDEKKNLWKTGSRIAVAGISAGAHLGLLYAYAYNTGGKVKAVVSVVGPADFSDPLYTGSPLFQLVAASLLGKTWTEDPEMHRMASPALRVNAASPPTFMAYGTADPIVPLSNAATLRSKLQANNITHTYVEYPGEGHEFSPAAVTNLVPRVITFLQTHL